MLFLSFLFLFASIRVSESFFPLSDKHLEAWKNRPHESLETLRSRLLDYTLNLEKQHEMSEKSRLLTHTYADFSRLVLGAGGTYCRSAVYTIVASYPGQSILPQTVATWCVSPTTQQVSAHVLGFGSAFWDTDGFWYSWPEAGLTCVQSAANTYSQLALQYDQLINIEVGRGFGLNVTQRRYSYYNLVRDAQFGPTYGAELITTDQFARFLTYSVSQTTGPNLPIPKFSATFQFDASTTSVPIAAILDRPSSCNSSVPLYDDIFFPLTLTCPDYILPL